MSELKVKFKVQKSDNVNELHVTSGASVGEFVASAQSAGFVPSTGISNIVVHRDSGALSFSDSLGACCESEILVVTWEECNERVAFLCEMGFSREAVVLALEAANNNVESAIDKLLHVAAIDNRLSQGSSSGLNETGVGQNCVSCQSDTRLSENSFVSHDSTGCSSGVSFDDTDSDMLRLKRAADYGDADSQLRYAYCCSLGLRVPMDFASAARYFKLAADQGQAAAQYCYGSLLQGVPGVPADPYAAARYFKLAAEQGYAKAQYSYGLCLQDGSGFLLIFLLQQVTSNLQPTRDMRRLNSLMVVAFLKVQAFLLICLRLPGTSNLQLTRDMQKLNAAMVFCLRMVTGFLPIPLLQHVTSNLRPSRAMQELNTAMVFVFKMVLEFLLISVLVHVTSNLLLNREMCKLNSCMVVAFLKVQAFLLICLRQHSTSNVQLIKDMGRLNAFMVFVMYMVLGFLLIALLRHATSNLQRIRESQRLNSCMPVAFMKAQLFRLV